MKRKQTVARNNWQEAVERIGFGFHTGELPYWDETVYYTLTIDEVAEIENATLELWQMCLTSVEYVIDRKTYDRFALAKHVIPMIEKSWEEDHPAIYGRFDLCCKDGQIKMLEFNADTPTSLFEAAVVQWYWLKDFDDSKDQFNSIHEKLVSYWAHLAAYLHPGPLYFSCIKDSLEDLTTTEYLRDTAMQGGLETKFIYIDEIGWDSARQTFLDNDGCSIRNIFKLYPHEMMMEEPFGKNMAVESSKTLWIEPAWKMLLSSKAILPVLWELFSGHRLLLESSMDGSGLKSYAEKPIWSREGCNIRLVQNGNKKLETTGAYGGYKTIFQSLFELPEFDGNYPVIGSWVIGQEAAGIGIRESASLITSNASRFVTHLIG